MKSFSSDTLLKGSLILLIAFNVFNVLNFLYNFVMVRSLTIEDYGTFTALNYIILFFAIFSESIQTVIAKYSAQEKDAGKIKEIMTKSLRKTVLFSSVLFCAYLVASYVIVKTLAIEFSLVAFTGLLIFLALLLPVTRGVIQGKGRFFSLGSNMVVEALIKILVGAGLVLTGARVYGAITGALIGALVAFAVSFIPLRDFIQVKKKEAATPDIYSYTKPVFVSMIVIIFFLTFDIILAKAFFSPQLAGMYAISSTLSKIVFASTQSMSKAMFPVSAASSTARRSRKILTKSLSFLTVAVLAVLLITIVFSSTIIRLYAGENIPEAAHILPILSLSMGFLAIANMLLFYRLSRGGIRFKYTLLWFIPFAGIILFMGRANIIQYSISFLATTVIFLMGSFLLVTYENSHNNPRA